LTRLHGCRARSRILACLAADAKPRMLAASGRRSRPYPRWGPSAVPAGRWRFHLAACAISGAAAGAGRSGGVAALSCHGRGQRHSWRWHPAR